MTLNLRTPEGRELFLRLVDGADVLVESFRPGVMDRLGLGYPTLAERNPRLIYASLSGFGQTGPYRDRPAHDLNYVALAGLLGFNVDARRRAGRARGAGCRSRLGVLRGNRHPGGGGGPPADGHGPGDRRQSVRAPPLPGCRRCSARAAQRRRWQAAAPVRRVSHQRRQACHPRRARAEVLACVPGAASVGRSLAALTDHQRAADRAAVDVRLDARAREWEQCLADVETCFAPVLSLDGGATDPQAQALGSIRR